MGNFAALALASAINGGSYGLSQPLMITLTSKVVGRDNQGKAIGLQHHRQPPRRHLHAGDHGRGGAVDRPRLGLLPHRRRGAGMLAIVAIGARGAIRRSGY